jgi:hypothetical protein
MKTGNLAVVVIYLSRTESGAQYVRTVEVAPARPFAPAPNVIAPSPDVAAPTIINPPAAVAPIPPPAVVQSQARPRKCWCDLVNPVTNSRQRTTCEIGCCKGGEQVDRC